MTSVMDTSAYKLQPNSLTAFFNLFFFKATCTYKTIGLVSVAKDSVTQLSLLNLV